MAMASSRSVWSVDFVDFCRFCMGSPAWQRKDLPCRPELYVAGTINFRPPRSQPIVRRAEAPWFVAITASHLWPPYFQCDSMSSLFQLRALPSLVGSVGRRAVEGQSWMAARRPATEASGPEGTPRFSTDSAHNAARRVALTG
jgi:hypothetical protein